MPVTRTFHWSDCAAVLREHAADPALAPDARLRWFGSEARRIHPPLVLPIPPGCASLAAYLDALPARPGKHLVVLMQAGAVSLGWFEGGEELATKSFRRYVVRGSGRAQPAHLAQKGKSRYGSRLRLQNARRLVEETNAKLREWWSAHGPPDHVYASAPVRLWPSLFEAHVEPPFDRDQPVVRIPLDLPRPTTDVLRRAYRALCHGRVEDL